jgi:hypothetical protein
LTAATEVENGGSLLWVRLIPFLMGGLLGWVLVSWQWGQLLQRPSAPVFPGQDLVRQWQIPLPQRMSILCLGSLSLSPLFWLQSRTDGGIPHRSWNPTPGAGQCFAPFPWRLPARRYEPAWDPPTSRGRGAWPNTVYDLYRFGGVDLGLLYDASSLALRQTEATVTAGVPTPQVEGLLEDMLQAPLPAQLQRELQAVREGRSGRVQFRVGPWAGRIERNAQGHLYMALWDPTLPSGAPPPSPSSPTPTPGCPRCPASQGP